MREGYFLQNSSPSQRIFALQRKFPTFAAKLQINEHLDYLFTNGRGPFADGRRHDTFVSADYIKK